MMRYRIVSIFFSLMAHLYRAVATCIDLRWDRRHATHDCSLPHQLMRRRLSTLSCGRLAVSGVNMSVLGALICRRDPVRGMPGRLCQSSPVCLYGLSAAVRFLRRSCVPYD